MNWPTKRQWQRQRQRQWQRQIHLESTFKERSQRLVTFDPFDQSDEETWPDQKKTMTKTKTKTMTKKMTKTNIFREHRQSVILETCDLWDIWSGLWGDMTWPWPDHNLTINWPWPGHNEKDNPSGLWHFRTLIIIRKIENLNPRQSLLPVN